MMDESSDHSTTVVLLLGSIVLVFAGIGFSLLVDKRFKFSSGQASLERSLADERAHLDKLQIQLEAARERWTTEIEPLAGQADDIESAAKIVREGMRRIDDLRGFRFDLEAGIAAEKEAFADHRAAFRQGSRAAAAGEKHDEIKSRGGRTYRDVTITRVTAEGVEISHAEGVSRLRPEDLDPSWQERFQWHPEERNPAGSTIQPAKVAEEAVAREPALPAGQELARQAAEKKLAGLRRDLAESLRYLGKAEAELSRARAEAEANRGRSDPGGLETLEERVVHLEASRAKFREQYEAARGRLAAAAPEDELLQDAPP
jgi:predicted  nucleic acid-binding Zn-ribbon protein